MSERGPKYRWSAVLGDPNRPAEESLTVRVAVLVALMTAGVAVLTSGVGGPFHWVMCLVVLPAGSAVAYVRRHDARPWINLAATIVTAAFVARFLMSHADVVSPGELRAPLAELLISMEAVRAASLRTRRDLRFAMTSSAALLAVAASMSLAMNFALPLLAWTAAVATGVVAAHRSELRDRLVPLTPTGVRRPRRAPLAGPLLALATAALVASTLFLIVPAARSSKLLAFTARLPQTGAVPQQGGLSNPSLGAENPSNTSSDDPSTGPRTAYGYFGFTDRLDTGVRGRPDDTLVMRVRASAPDFWRGQTFDVWDGRAWTMSDERTTIARAARGPIEMPQLAADPPTAGSEFIQTVFLETTGPNLIFGANRVSRVYIPQSVLFQVSDGAIRTGVELEAGTAYTVVSYRPAATTARLRGSGQVELGTPADILTRYATRSPTPPRVRALADELTRDLPSTYDKVMAIQTWLGANTKYSLDIPPLPEGEDAVERFLFVDRIGFCEQIASSLVVMLRSQGIPARLAVGYTPGERNPFTGLFEVRARDAHAWAEVYFPGVGWQAFDPTASVPLAGEPPADAARVGLRSYLAKRLSALPDAAFAAAGAVLAGGVVLLLWGPLTRRRMRRRAERDRPWADSQLERIEALGRALERERRPGETAREYCGALMRTVLPDPSLGPIADALERDAFGPAPLDDVTRRAVEAAIGELGRSRGGDAVVDATAGTEAR